MSYVEQIHYYIQIGDYIDEYYINDFNERVTANNIHTFFFYELKQHNFNGQNSLEMLFRILEEHNIDLEHKDGKIIENNNNYKKIRDFIYKEEQKYRYELLKINLNDYFTDSTHMNYVSILNNAIIIEESLKNIEKYNEVTLYYYEHNLTVEETIGLVSNFFKDIDRSGELLNAFKKFMLDENVFIWNDEDKTKQELLKSSKLGVYCSCYDLYESAVVQIDDELFANIYCQGCLLDCYCLIHEFIHYYIIKENTFEEQSECSSFYSEFPSIFFEYLFNLYLKEKDLFDTDRDIQIEERKVENLKNVFLTSATYELYKTNIENDHIDFERFYANYANSSGFKNFESKALNVYEAFYEEIYECDRFCDLLNINLSDIDFSNITEYISGTLFSEELIKQIKNGKTYLIDRIIKIIKSLSYTQMDPTYILEFLELNYRFYSFKPISENVVPKRLEKLKQ